MFHAPDSLNLTVDLQGGMVPISKASGRLAALFRRARERRQAIILTQKGYPAGVLLPIEIYHFLQAQAEQAAGREGEPAEGPASP